MKETLELRDKQRKTLELCKENKCFGVFMDMGAGKTATMLELIDYLAFDTFEVSKVLILAPNAVITKAKVWQKEMEKWKNFAYFDFLEISGTKKQREEKVENSNNTICLMNDTLLEWYKDTYKNLDDFDMIIIDESSRFKSPTAQRFKTLSSMIQDKHRVYLLSGTPMPNGFQDLWSQMYLMDKGARLGYNYYKFIAKYGYYVNDYKFTFLKTTQAILRQKIEDICIFVDSGEIPLPPKNEHIVNLSWGEEKNKTFKQFKKDYVLSINNGELAVMNITSYINKSLQMSNGCVYTNKEGSYQVFDDTKLNWVREFSKTARDNMLVFYSFKFDKQRLLTLEGAREIMTAQDVDDWNNGLIKIGVISPYSFQYGGNFQQGGSIVIWFGLLWGLENYLQSNKRVWRSGQKKEVDIYYLLMEDTNDMSVYKRLISKDMEEQEFLESIKLY